MSGGLPVVGKSPLVASGGLSVAMMSFAAASAQSFPGGLAVEEVSDVSEGLAAAAEQSSSRSGSLLVFLALVLVLVLVWVVVSVSQVDLVIPATCAPCCVVVGVPAAAAEYGFDSHKSRKKPKRSPCFV